MFQARWFFLGFLGLAGIGIVAVSMLRVHDWQAMTVAVEAALEAGDYAAAEAEATLALGATTAFSPLDERTLRSQTNLARALRGQHRFNEAAAIYQRMLATLAGEFGDNSLTLVAPLRALAEIEAAQSRFAAARPQFERALELATVGFGPDHPIVARTQGDLARVMAAQEEFTAAVPVFEAAIAAFEALSADALADSAIARDHGAALAGLAGVFHTQGRLDEAEAMLNQALVVYETPGPGRVAGLSALSAVYYRRAVAAGPAPDALILDQAANAGRRAYQMAVEILGTGNALTAAAETAYANALLAQGDIGQAATLHQDALAIREDVFGPEYIDIAENLNALATIFQAQGKLQSAESNYHRALSIIGKARGPEHPEVAASLYNLANHYAGQGRIVDAEPLYQRAVAIREAVFGPDAPIVATTLQAYATLLRAAGRIAAADRTEARAAAIIAAQ